MSERNFMALLQAQMDQDRFLCVGLDSGFDLIPDAVKVPLRNKVLDSTVEFNRRIVDATKDYVCAYKLNRAFYAKYLTNGFKALERTIRYINEVAPDVPVIFDPKSGDIGNSNNGYVAEAFDVYNADAVTVPPYMGRESLQPFLDQGNKGIIVLARTSNPGAGEFQDLPVLVGMNDTIPVTHPLYQIVAAHVARSWNEHGNCLVVAGGTSPDELGEIRQLVGDMPMLIPGYGKQGGRLEDIVPKAKNSRGQGMIINSSREIILASSGSDYAEVAGERARAAYEKILSLL